MVKPSKNWCGDSKPHIPHKFIMDTEIKCLGIYETKILENGFIQEIPFQMGNPIPDWYWDINANL